MYKKVLKRKDFIQLNQLACYYGNAIRINYRKTKIPLFRVGITVTRKWANAVKRNLFKRRIKHSLHSQPLLPKYMDLQIKPKWGKEPTFSQIQADFTTFFKKTKCNDNI